MKKILLILALLPFIGWNQSISPLDSATFVNLEPGAFEYVNMSVTGNLKIEAKTDVVLDLGALDVPTQFDSVKWVIGEKSFVSTDLSPMWIKGLNASTSVDVMAFHKGDTLTFASSDVKSLSLSVTRLEAPIFSDDRIVFGILALVLALVFYTAHLKGLFWKRFYTVVPALLLCYLIPALLAYFGVISKDHTSLYNMAKDYLLPGALILMTIGIDFKGLMNLGPKALIMFLAGTLGVIIGGPIAIMIYKNINPAVVGGEGFDAAWRGFSTLAGSWIGGGANQAAMLEAYSYNPNLYGKMVTVDIVVANLWMAFLLWAAARADMFDRWLKADSSSIEELKTRVSNYQTSIARQPSLTDYLVIAGITFSIVGVSHFAGEYLAEWLGGFLDKDNALVSSFFWMVVFATTGGLVLSGTKLRQYEGAGASKIGGVFIYILVATIGMKMELAEAVKDPELILVGIIWMLVHASVMFIIARLIKAPFFFLAVGSKANIGGAASAPIVASAFHPSLASVGAILAVFGYALGTYGAWLCAWLMEMVAP
jgi:uncharacterized membrane protein